MPQIAVFTKNRTNPAYEAARLGAERVAATFGATTTHYVPERPDNVEEQIALIARAIGERPDAVVLTPVHDSAVNDAILSFDAARIPVVNFVVRSTVGQRLCFVGSDDRALAADIADYLFRTLKGRGDIAILEGTAASPTSHERLKGFHDVLAAYPDIRVRASLCGEYQREAARKVYAAAADRLSGIDGVLCANDVMALGVLDALASSGREPPPIVGVNAIPEAITAIASGKMLATADFNAMAMSCIATEAALRHLRGEVIPREVMLPVQIVDASNCAQWDLPFAARACPSWQAVTGLPD